jgi:hypothetical protein
MEVALLSKWLGSMVLCTNCSDEQNMDHHLLNDHPTVENAYQGEAAPPDCLMAGVFAACPANQSGMVATFHNLLIVKGSTFVHDP